MKTQTPSPTPVTEYLASTLLGIIIGTAIVFVLWVLALYLGGAFTLR